MTREASREQRETAAALGSASLLLRLEQQFAMFSRKHKIDYLDARTLLMNCVGL